MSIKKQYIPAPLASAVKGGYVTDASEILDENKGKRQDEINQETDNEISGIKGGSTKSIADLSEDIANEVERSSGVEAGLRESIDELGHIGLNPENAISTDGDDFNGDTTAERSKIPTIGAIIDGNPGVYDVSKRNPTGGPSGDGKFTLKYILDNANTLIPTSRRHGGMEICFVHSSDNKYVKFFLTKDEWSASVTDWEKINLEKEIDTINGKIDKNNYSANFEASGTDQYLIGTSRVYGMPITGKTFRVDINSITDNTLDKWRLRCFWKDGTFDTEVLHNGLYEKIKELLGISIYLTGSNTASSIDVTILTAIPIALDILDKKTLSNSVYINQNRQGISTTLGEVCNYVEMEIGAISSSDGANLNNTVTRARTCGYLKAPFNIKISSDYKLRTLFKYSQNSNGTVTFISHESVISDYYRDLTITDKRYVYRLVANKNTDSTEITENDIEDIVIGYKGAASSELTNLPIPHIYADVDSVIEVEVGGLNNAGLNDDTTVTRARTKQFVSAPFKISTNNGYRIRLYFKYTLNADGTFTKIGNVSLQSDERYNLSVTDTQYVYRLVFNKETDTQEITNPNEIVGSFVGALASVKDKVFANDSLIYIQKMTGNLSNFSAHFGGNLLAEYGSVSGSADFTFPEYSQYCILLAKKAGFNMLGLNIDITSDGVVVCSHDLTINRTMRNKADYSVISNSVKIAENTYTALVDGYVCNTSIERLRLPLLKFEDALKTCKSLNLGVVVLPSSTSGVTSAAIELLNKYGFENSGILSLSRPSGYKGLMITYAGSKKTKQEIMTALEKVGKPACFMMDDTVNLYTDEELIDIADTVHENGYLLSASLHGSKENYHKLRSIGAFDFSNVDNDVPVFENGDIESIRSIADFNSFVYDGGQEIFNGVLQEDESLSHTTQNQPTMCKACLKVHFKGSFKLTFGTGYSALEVYSDGSFISVFTNVFYNVASSFTIVALEETEVYDVEFDVSKIM